MSRCLFTPEAVEDLKGILEHIARDRPKAAVKLVDRLEEQCRELVRFPELGRRREELSAGLRSFPSGRYVIFYRATQNGIEVIRVLHGARDVPAIFESDGS